VTDKLARLLEAVMDEDLDALVIDLEAEAEEDYWASMVECDYCGGECVL
jgi:hypothetical protein